MSGKSSQHPLTHTTSDNRKVTLQVQITEVERELKMRGTVYTGQVARGRMKQSEADYHIANMTAVLDTLKWLKANEAAVRAAHKREKADSNPAETLSRREWTSSAQEKKSGRT